MRIIIPHTSYVMLTSESKVLSIFYLEMRIIIPHTSYVMMTAESKVLSILPRNEDYYSTYKLCDDDVGEQSSLNFTSK